MDTPRAMTATPTCAPGASRSVVTEAAASTPPPPPLELISPEASAATLVEGMTAAAAASDAEAGGAAGTWLLLGGVVPLEEALGVGVGVVLALSDTPASDVDVPGVLRGAMRSAAQGIQPERARCCNVNPPEQSRA